MQPFSLEEFIQAHRAQLLAADFPESLWPMLFKKLSREVSSASPPGFHLIFFSSTDVDFCDEEQASWAYILKGSLLIGNATLYFKGSTGLEGRFNWKVSYVSPFSGLNSSNRGNEDLQLRNVTRWLEHEAVWNYYSYYYFWNRSKSVHGFDSFFRNFLAFFLLRFKQVSS